MLQGWERNEVVDISEHLPGLGLAAGAGGEVGEGLGGHGQAQPGAAALVEKLDKRVVDHLGGLVDEDVHGREIHPVVVAVPGHSGKIRHQDRADGAADHAVGEGVESKIHHLGALNALGHGGEAARVPRIGGIRREQRPQVRRGQHVQDRHERGDHFGEMHPLVLEQIGQPVDDRGGVARAHRLAIVAHQARDAGGRIAGLAQEGLRLALPGRHVLPQVAYQDALDQGLGAALQIAAQGHQARALADGEEALDHVGHGHLAEGLEGVVAGLARDQGGHAAGHLGGAVEAV